MNLKESFRYANYLDSLLDKAYLYLNNKGFITTVTQNHMRSKVNSEATDEIVQVQKPYDVEFTPMNVVDFVVRVLNEKERLADAIAVAKANAEINIDNAVALNKKKQMFAGVLNCMSNIKPSEKQTQGSDYRFNINNEQVLYRYNVTEVTQIDFNRNDVRNLAKKYLKEADEISAKLDAIVINTSLEFEPLFDENSMFEELIAGN